MSVIGPALGAAAGLAAVGTTAGVLVPGRGRTVVVGTCTAGAGVAGLLAGVAALGGVQWSLQLPGLLPLAGVRLAVDALSGLFMAVAGAVVAAVAVYGSGTRKGTRGRAGTVRARVGRRPFCRCSR